MKDETRSKSSTRATRGAAAGGDDAEDAAGIDPKLLAAIREAVKDAVREEMVTINQKLDRFTETVNKLDERIEEVEKGLQFNAERLEAAMTVTLPALADHVTKVSEALTSQHLQLEVHRRKWNLILHGLDGPAGEDAQVTRKACMKFAKDVLKVPDAENTRFAACHRLSREQNAGIIVRFCDLADRDKWLSGTRNLRNSNRKISVSPDLPPVLRPLKDSLMLKRSKMRPELKSKSRVRYLPQWPFAELKVEGQAAINPTETLASIVSKKLGMNHIFRVTES